MKSSSINKPPGRTPGLIHRLWRTVAKPWALALLGCLAIGTGAQAQIVLTGTSYTADFSSYAGTSESVPTGWSMTSSDFNPGGLYAGTSGTGSNYYWVYDGNRHLGIQRSGSGAWGTSTTARSDTRTPYRLMCLEQVNLAAPTFRALISWLRPAEPMVR